MTTVTQNRRNWSKEEIEYLEETWGQKSITYIANKLGRKNSGVIAKAEKLKFKGCYMLTEHLNVLTVSKMLGIDTHTVKDYWIDKCGLKAKKRALNVAEMWVIRLEDLLKWLKDNKDKWDSRKIELNALGKEPAWLKEKRITDEKLPKNHSNLWSVEEVGILISYYKIGKPKEELAKMLNRSVGAIQRKISKLKSAGRLPMDKVMCKWTEEEEKLFRKYECKGLTDVEIAYELGRERWHIVDHRKNLKKRGKYFGRKISKRA